MSKLICPNCGVYTSFSSLMIEGKGILKEESGSGRLVFGEVSIGAVCPDEYSEPTYAILICQACRKRFVAEKNKSTDAWSAVYPIPHKSVTKEIPEPVKGEFEEAHLCFAVRAYRASVSMCETALEALWREQEASGLLDLKDKGIISPQLYDRANEVRLWGNVAKHELVSDVVAKEDTEQLLAYVDALLNAVYVEPKRLDTLRRKREQIEKKQA